FSYSVEVTLSFLGFLAKLLEPVQLFSLRYFQNQQQ
ncbi:MAG: hypothetical protein ACI8RD_007623, partial [Bacillariaceae sp.]